MLLMKINITEKSLFLQILIQLFLYLGILDTHTLFTFINSNRKQNSRLLRIVRKEMENRKRQIRLECF